MSESCQAEVTTSFYRLVYHFLRAEHHRQLARFTDECRAFHEVGSTERDDNALICLASLQATDPEDMSAIQRSSAAHRRLQWFHWCTSPGRRGQIATIAFEADPALVAHLARNSLPIHIETRCGTVDFASPFNVKFWNGVRNRDDQLRS